MRPYAECCWDTCSTVIPSAECQSTVCVEQIHTKYHIMPDMHSAYACDGSGFLVSSRHSAPRIIDQQEVGPSYTLRRPNCIHYRPLYPKSLLPFSPVSQLHLSPLIWFSQYFSRKNSPFVFSNFMRFCGTCALSVVYVVYLASWMLGENVSRI